MLGPLLLPGEKVIMPIHEEADRLSHQLESMLAQQGSDALGGTTGEQCIPLEAGVECGCVTAAKAKRVQPYPQAHAAGIRFDLQMVSLYSA